MRTYALENRGRAPLYEYLYRCIRGDILDGTLTAGERLPSKRALADVLLGSPIYAPATLVIKAGMAALAAACHQAFGKGRGPLGLAACGIMGELPMVVGYWLYDALLLGSAAGAAAGIPSNLVQAAFGIAASTLLAAALGRSAYVRREFPRL